MGSDEADEPMACGGGTPNMNLENLEPSRPERHDLMNESQLISRSSPLYEGLEDYYSWLTKKSGVGLSTRLVLTDQLARRTQTPTRKRWSYLVVTLPNSDMQIGTWTMVYDEGFEVSTTAFPSGTCSTSQLTQVRIGKKRFFGIMKYRKAGGTKCAKTVNGE